MIGPVESDIVLNAVRKPNSQATEDDKKMLTSRCSFLILKGLYLKFDEFWISEQPILLFIYLHKYFPFITRPIIKNIMGPVRLKIIEEGGSLFDIKVNK